MRTKRSEAGCVAPSLIHMCLNVCQRTAITQLFISAHENRNAERVRQSLHDNCEPARQLQGVGHRSIRVTAADQDGICIDGAVRTPLHDPHMVVCLESEREDPSIGGIQRIAARYAALAAPSFRIRRGMGAVG